MCVSCCPDLRIHTLLTLSVMEITWTRNYKLAVFNVSMLKYGERIIKGVEVREKELREPGKGQWPGAVTRILSWHQECWTSTHLGPSHSLLFLICKCGDGLGLKSSLKLFSCYFANTKCAVPFWKGDIIWYNCMPTSLSWPLMVCGIFSVFIFLLKTFLTSVCYSVHTRSRTKWN